MNNDVGAKTPLAQFVCGLLVMFVLLFLTPVFKLMPYNCLAAVIIIGVSTLVDLETPIHFFKVSRLCFHSRGGMPRNAFVYHSAAGCLRPALLVAAGLAVASEQCSRLSK